VIVRSFGYPVVVVALGIGVIPAALCLQTNQGELAKVGVFHRHLAANGQREVHVVGKAQGTSLTSVSGRSCLAYQYWVQRGSGKNWRTVCSGGERGDFELSVSPGEHLDLSPSSALRLRLAEHKNVTKYTKKIDSKACDSAGPRDTLVEVCLLPGDEVEVWACREPGSNLLVPCHDGVDEIESPPAGGMHAVVQRKVRRQLAFAMLWLCAWAAVALALLSREIVALTRRRAPADGEEPSV
jgi:hypothetical protein